MKQVNINTSSTTSNKRNSTSSNTNKISKSSKKVNNNIDLELNSDYDDDSNDDNDDDYSNFEYNNNVYRKSSSSGSSRKKKVTSKKSKQSNSSSGNARITNSTATKRANSVSVSYRPTPIVEEKPVAPVLDEAGMEAAIEAETKLRTLKLRVAGQQQTIKVLEAQLSEALQTLDIRNKQLSYTARNR